MRYSRRLCARGRCRSPGPLADTWWRDSYGPDPADAGRTLLAGGVGPTRRAAAPRSACADDRRSEEHTSELQSRQYLVCRLLLEKNKISDIQSSHTTNR